MDDSVYVLGWDSLPAGDDADGVPVACPVVPVFVKPVPAVAEEIRAEPQHHCPGTVSLSANPVKRCVKRAFTCALKTTKNAQPLVTGCKTDSSYLHV